MGSRAVDTCADPRLGISIGHVRSSKEHYGEDLTACASWPENDRSIPVLSLQTNPRQVFRSRSLTSYAETTPNLRRYALLHPGERLFEAVFHNITCGRTA